MWVGGEAQKVLVGFSWLETSTSVLTPQGRGGVLTQQLDQHLPGQSQDAQSARIEAAMSPLLPASSQGDSEWSKSQVLVSARPDPSSFWLCVLEQVPSPP